MLIASVILGLCLLTLVVCSYFAVRQAIIFSAPKDRARAVLGVYFLAVIGMVVIQVWALRTTDWAALENLKF